MAGEQGTNGTPGSDGQSGTGSDASVASQGGKITFTPEQQEHVNRIVAQRVNEVKGQFSQAAEDSKVLQGLLKDQDFLSWVNGDRQSPPGGQSPQDPLEALMDKEELSGKEVVTLVSALLNRELQPITRTIQDTAATTRNVGLETHMQRLASQVNPQTGEAMYPYLWDQEFRTEVASALGKRASSIEDAYFLIQRDRESSGKGVPQTAFLLDGGGAPRGIRRQERGDEQPKTLDDLGLKPGANGKKPGLKQILQALVDKQT